MHCCVLPSHSAHPTPHFWPCFGGDVGRLAFGGDEGQAAQRYIRHHPSMVAMGGRWGCGKQRRRCASARNAWQQDKQRTQLKRQRLSYGGGGRTRLAMCNNSWKAKKGQHRILPGTCRCHPEHNPRACGRWGMRGTRLVTNEAIRDNPARMKNTKRRQVAHRCTHGAAVFVALQAVGRAVVKLGFHGGCACSRWEWGIMCYETRRECMRKRMLFRAIHICGRA